MSSETARATGRKVGTTSSQHGLYALGHTHATMADRRKAGCPLDACAKQRCPNGGPSGLLEGRL